MHAAQTWNDPMVLANAVVDVIRPATPKGLGTFKVEVWGKSPHDFVKTYTITAKNETNAAQEGIRRFVAEIEQLIAQEG